MRTLIAILVSTMLVACGEHKTSSSTEAEPPPTSLAVDLRSHDFPFTVELGDPAILGVDSPSVRWNEEIGVLEVKAGDHFSIVLSEEPGDMASVKATLGRDLLATNEIITDAPDRLVWRAQFPDESIVFVHFYRIVEEDGRSFVVRDDGQGRFTEADIARMVDAVRTQQPV